MSWFETLEPAHKPLDILVLKDKFIEDRCPQKLGLNVGAYRDDRGKPWLLPCVAAAQKIIDTTDKEYLHTFGLPGFGLDCAKFLLGEENLALIENRVFGIQTLSGAGALRLGAEFLTKGKKVFYHSNPSWVTHESIFQNAGFTVAKEYRYWHEQNKGLDFQGLLDDLSEADENSVVILQACAHNPTGCDPSNEQWKQIAEIFQTRKLFPFFDCAYQGFASGNSKRDAWAVRYFASLGLEFFCAQSFSKNFGLYNERVGNLCVVTRDLKTIPVIKSYFTDLVTSMYLNPPAHGAKIVSYILNNENLFIQWQKDIKTMSDRIILMRKKLREELEIQNSAGCWQHITQQAGMFSYTGLTKKQSEHMIDKYHVYMLSTGRMSMAGLTLENVGYVARAMHDVINTVSTVKTQNL